MSRSTFVTRFVEVYGQTPFDFLQTVRLRQAAQLLRGSDIGVKAIAESTGFSSRSHFSRTFKATYGMDPTGYRTKQSQGALV